MAIVTTMAKKDIIIPNWDNANSLSIEMPNIPAPETRGTNLSSLKLISSVFLMLS